MLQILFVPCLPFMTKAGIVYPERGTKKSRCHYFPIGGDPEMKLKTIIHQAEEGGYWAEVPAIPGCFTQGETWEELIQNIYEAVEACLSIDVEEFKVESPDKILEIAI